MCRDGCGGGIELKTWPEFFQAVWEGRKTFEIRKDDRGYRVGDCLHLREWAPPAKGYEGRPVDLGYTGRQIAATVTYLVRDAWGLPPGLVVMCIRETDRLPRTNASRAPGGAPRCKAHGIEWPCPECEKDAPAPAAAPAAPPEGAGEENNHA